MTKLRRSDPAVLATVSYSFVEDWLSALRTYCSDREMNSFLDRAGMGFDQPGHAQRVTLDQIVRLYQIAAIETEDEMMGLWSRPIRSRALQHLITTIREASTLHSALHRFTTFWNLLLDDFRFGLNEKDGAIVLQLHPLGDLPIQRFGHMLIMKLAHGLISWLAEYEVPVREVEFAFERPVFAEDYAVIFPASVGFGAPLSSISFEKSGFVPPKKHGNPELTSFLYRAPRDWIFTSYWEHTLSLQIREFIYRSEWEKCQLDDAARVLGVTPRTLMRRLEAEGTSFQSIKDGLRRDMAIRELQSGNRSIEEVSQDVGFSSASNFHRAFRKWTGANPSEYRK
ncbi:MAG: AraC family transcriptional regulator ligand-binding domain-containing protein [Pseudomonadota bacterium]